MGLIASGQITLEPIDSIDGYSVGLSSDSYVFMGNSTGAPSGLSCTTQAVAYCGSKQCSNLNISTISCPVGISATISNNNTSFPTITFETTATITEACEAVVTIIVDDVAVNKKFSFAIAKTGVNGSDGKGIKSTDITYQASSSGTVAPTGEWTEDVPDTTSDMPYLWSRTVITYTDDTTSTAYSVGSTPSSIIVGGRNLIRNSRNMIYADYYFKADIVVTHDGNGNLIWVSPAITVENDGVGNVTMLNIAANDDGVGNVYLSLE